MTPTYNFLKYGRQNGLNLLGQPVYLPKIGKLDLKNNDMFKLARFQPDSFNIRVKWASSRW